ncbi:MAG: uroporphyrinogen-III C-methyltransferase [Desulfobacteraceae bacterium]|nr:uroporphyrinogen-III C-methyltransferase [Desulfobacteraceae bacterium]
MPSQPGTVYLVGAGPGDPDLITVKGLECIRTADVVIYDYLASPQLLRNVRHDAEVLYVGKKGGDHTLSQEGINRLLVEKARKGFRVARLKGGDPFIFGRGGEEAEVLVQAGIPFEVVPGVTSAVAAPAYAGIPLTHRDHTATLALVTGHEDPTKQESNIDWSALSGIGTLVFLMGVKNLPRIVERLLEEGRPPETPVAAVRWGTTAAQQTVTGDLRTIAGAVKAAGLKAPAIIVVGEVVHLREKLRWFENRPLFGKRIVVTRARHQASELVARLAALGAECIECPAIRIVPPESWAPLDAAVASLGDYHWLVFTSVNGVRFFFERLFALGKDVRSLGHLKTAVIGPATRDRLLEFGLRADILPESYRAESVVEAFRTEEVRDRRILLPRAEEARSVLPEELGRMGAHVDDVTVYRTEREPESTATLQQRLRERTVDAVTFTSSSTVRNFLDMLPPETQSKNLLQGVVLASIGPVTTETAEASGLSIRVTAETYTIEGLCEALVRSFQVT